MQVIIALIIIELQGIPLLSVNVMQVCAPKAESSEDDVKQFSEVKGQWKK